MKIKISGIAGLITTIFLATGVSANGTFDYQRTQWLYVITESEFHVYAKFPGFLEFRNLIANKMQSAERTMVEGSPPIYELRLVGVGEQKTLYVGRSWIGDGNQAATLSDSEFTWIRTSVQARGEGNDLRRLDSSIRKVVHSQKDTAWQADP